MKKWLSTWWNRSRLAWNMASKLSALFVVYRLWHFYRRYAQGRHGLPRSLDERQKSQQLISDGDPRFASYLQNEQGMWLYTQKWVPAHDVIVKGVVFIVHGLGEHIGRYAHVASIFTSNGYVVFGMDHQGHGRSEGDRLFVESFEHVSRDYLKFIVKTLATSEKLRIQQDEAEEHVVLNTLPRFLLGHSMGGAITLLLLEKSRSTIPWNGIILSGPALKPDHEVVKPFIRIVARFLSIILPKLPVNEVNPWTVSCNALICGNFLRDPLVPKCGVSARLATELLDSMEHLVNTMGTITESLLILHGASDSIVSPQGSVDLSQKTNSHDVKLKIYPHLYHEILNSDDHAGIVHDILLWMEDRR